jgi:hypothetical protein
MTTEPTQQEPSPKKPTNFSGYLLIVLGIVGITSRFIGTPNWSNAGILKLVVSIVVLIYGIYSVFIRKK